MIVQSIGYQYAHRDGMVIDRPRGVGFHVFVLFKSPVRMVRDGEELWPPLYSCILFRKDTPHYYDSDAKLYINDWVHFEGEDIDAFMDRIGVPCNTLLTPPDAQMISRFVKEMHNEKQGDGRNRDELVDTLLRCMLLKLAECAPGNIRPVVEHPWKDIFTDIRNQIYSMPWQRPGVAELAARVSLSKSHFQHMYRALFGVSVLSDMVSARMAHACYLLENSHASIARIAERCGYDNDVHFMRQFKKVMGVTPKNWRNK